jgi:hypothetical protein
MNTTAAPLLVVNGHPIHRYRNATTNDSMFRIGADRTTGERFHNLGDAIAWAKTRTA